MEAEMLIEEAAVNVSLLIQEGDTHSSKELQDVWAYDFDHAGQASCTLT